MILFRLFRIDPTPVEIISAVALLAWGMTMALGRWGHLDPYVYLLGYANGVTWGCLAATLGILQGLALAMHYVPPRQACAFAAAALWCTIAVTTVAAAPLSPAPWVYLVVGVANGWAFVQVPQYRGDITAWRSRILS